MNKQFFLLALLATGIGLLIPGCEGRDHLNPLDPLNPGTGGVPDNLNAVAGDGEIALNWNDLGFEDLEGYDLLRVEEESQDSAFLNATPIPSSETQWTDGDLTNGHTYTYTLFFLTPGGETLQSSPDTATPGPTVVWLVDFNSPSMRRVSPDGRDLVARISGLSGPLDIVVSPVADAIWVADYFGGQVMKYNVDGGLLLFRNHNADGRGLPVSLGHSVIDNSVWVGGRNPDGVSQISENGEEIAYYPTISYPIAIDIDSTDGTVWVASLNDNAIYRKQDGEGGFTKISGFSRPRSLSVDPLSGRCWVADDYGIKVLNRQGDVVFSLQNFITPEVVAVDGSDGSCWVAHLNGDWSISRLTAQGGTELRVDGFDFISDMTVDSSNGVCWLTTVGTTEGEVVKVSREGEILGRVGRLAYPTAISLLP